MTSLPAFVKGLGLQLHGKCQGEKRVNLSQLPHSSNTPQSPYQIPICVLSGARINTDQKIAEQWVMSLLALNKES